MLVIWILFPRTQLTMQYIIIDHGKSGTKRTRGSGRQRFLDEATADRAGGLCMSETGVDYRAAALAYAAAERDMDAVNAPRMTAAEIERRVSAASPSSKGAGGDSAAAAAAGYRRYLREVNDVAMMPGAHRYTHDIAFFQASYPFHNDWLQTRRCVDWLPTSTGTRTPPRRARRCSRWACC